MWWRRSNGHLERNELCWSSPHTRSHWNQTRGYSAFLFQLSDYKCPFHVLFNAIFFSFLCFLLVISLFKMNPRHSAKELSHACLREKTFGLDKLCSGMSCSAIGCEYDAIESTIILNKILLTETYIKQAYVLISEWNVVTQRLQEVTPYFPLGTLLQHSLNSIHGDFIEHNNYCK